MQRDDAGVIQSAVHCALIRQEELYTEARLSED